MLESLKSIGFEIKALHHAEAILNHDMRDALDELERVMLDVNLPVEELVRGGGGEGQLTQRIRRAFAELGWKKHEFEIRKTIDGRETEFITHEIDHVRKTVAGTFALEIEWNNKDPFFDRDLENFKRLHADGAISIGAIVTRGTSLHGEMVEIIESFAQSMGIDSIEKIREYYDPTRRQLKAINRAAEKSGHFGRSWAARFVADKFGEATTHWKKLMDRVDRGVGNPCPLLLIGMPRSIVVP